MIRHAVAIDERRAKFRQNLISQKRKDLPPKQNAKRQVREATLTNGHNEKAAPPPPPQRAATSDFARFTPRRNALYPTSKSASRRASHASTASINSTTAAQPYKQDFGGGGDDREDDDDDENAEQDVQEIWYPGCHADIGGGWPQEPGMEAGLSHAPLLWMIREARKAGMPFDERALEEAGFVLEDIDEESSTYPTYANPIPEIRIQNKRQRSPDRNVAGYDLLHIASTKGVIHDSLEFNCGTPRGGVFAWRAMEYLPFRRMDLKSDGTWAPIRWPLPCGEVRDIPEDAWIHSTAIKRMDADPQYRPGNLIIGGGGRGVRKAPAHMGMGNWNVLREKGNPVGETFIRALNAEDEKSKE